MNDTVAMYIIIGLIVILAVTAIVLFLVVLRCLDKLKAAETMYGMMAEEREADLICVSKKLKHQIAINKLMSSLLFDIGRATEPNELRWKMYCIRKLEEIVTATGEMNYGLYEWFTKTLADCPKNTRNKYLGRVEDELVSYFIMDVNQRIALRDMLSNIAEIGSLADIFDNGHKKLIKQLHDSAKKINFKLVVVEDTPKRVRKHADKKEDLLDCAQELNEDNYDNPPFVSMEYSTGDDDKTTTEEESTDGECEQVEDTPQEVSEVDQRGSADEAVPAAEPPVSGEHDSEPDSVDPAERESSDSGVILIHGNGK